MGELRKDRELETLLSILRIQSGIDFTHYKRSTLRRRIEKRMRAVHVRAIHQYRALLEADPNELAPLLDSLLVNVSGFFRNPEVWTFLSKHVIPRILERRPASAIRAWSAGCSAGQEPYTLAIVLAEIMGVEDFCGRVKILATDLDRYALARARRARYDSHALESVPKALRAKYFEDDGGDFLFHRRLRASVIFSRHDLLTDRPRSDVDMLFCRNTLMYFTVQARSRVLRSFAEALNDAGFLVVGRDEMLFQQPRFATVEIRHGVYRRIETTSGAVHSPRWSVSSAGRSRSGESKRRWT